MTGDRPAWVSKVRARWTRATLLRAIVARLGWAVATLWLVVTLSFVLMRIAPGGPFSSDKPLPPAVESNLKRTFGLAADVRSPVAGTVAEVKLQAGDKPADGAVAFVLLTANGPVYLPWPPGKEVVRIARKSGQKVEIGGLLAVRATSVWEQYTAALASYATGDFGVTYASEGSRTVLENIGAGFAVSFELGFYALIIALLVGVGSGVLAAARHGTWWDHGVMTGALLAVSLSSIVVGPLLVLVFCVQLRWLPWGGWQPWLFADGAYAVKILPALTLGLIHAAWFSRLVRAGMLEVLEQPWIVTARAKGLTERQVIFRHALRPALIPAVSYLGPALAGIVTGSVVVERIFSIPGVGEHFVSAALNRDYPMVMGTVVLYAALLIVANIAVDLAAGLLDPRAGLDADHG